MEYLTLEQHGYISVDCVKCGHIHRAIRPCGLRFCPVCALKRRIRVRNHLHELFKLIKRRPGYRIKMLTLSTPNPEDLKKGVNDLIGSFRRLRQRQFWKKYVDGGLAVIEIKGRPGSWHPHLHVILYSKFLPWAEVRKHWEKVSGGTAVWISNIPQGKAIYYVTKYVTKIDCPDIASEDPNIAMQGRHLFMKFGDWARIKLPIRKFLFICVNCGASDWLTEFDLRRLSKSLRGG